MTLKLLLALTVLFLTGCVSPTVRDDSPANDLDALEANVKRDLQTRVLSNGKEYCAELARTEQAQDECLGELEDGFYASNRDKERAADSLAKGIQRIRHSRNPCRWWQWGCRREARELER